jgi:hypothetical protein
MYAIYFAICLIFAYQNRRFHALENDKMCKIKLSFYNMGERLKYQEYIFDLVLYTTYFLYILAALGLSATAPQHLSTLDYYTKMYVALFLIYRFNPLRDVKFTSLDKKIAFSAGFFVFTTTALNQILESFKLQLNNFFTSFYTL